MNAGLSIVQWNRDRLTEVYDVTIEKCRKSHTEIKASKVYVCVYLFEILCEISKVVFELSHKMLNHYIDVIMTTMEYQIASLAVVYSTVYSDAGQRKHQSSASLAFVWGIHRDRWIPRTKGQLRGKGFIWWRHHAIHTEGTLQCTVTHVTTGNL